MKITGGKWAQDINLLFIKCSCGNSIVHRADRWIVKCPKCSRIENLQELRNEYANGVAEEKGAGNGQDESSV